MTQTKRSASALTGSPRPVSSSVAIIIGLGDGSTTRTMFKMRWMSVLTIRLPGEPMTEVPGLVFHCNGERDIGNVMDQMFIHHQDILNIGRTTFFDRHPISVAESIRKDFCDEFYRVVADKPLEFGDDILDGLQGALHMAKNAHLLSGPTPGQMIIGNTPAIAIGAGPSLKRHIPALRELQHKCILLACDSLLDSLLDEGITPHLVTPVERIPEIAAVLTRTDYTTIFAGKPVVHHDAAAAFKNFWFCPCSDVLYGWCMAKETELGSYGQSTGTMTVSLAAKLTTGPIYLVGHDLSMDGKQSHYAGAKATAITQQQTFPVPGYAGEVFTDWCWDGFRRHIEATAGVHGNVLNVNAHDMVGAIIANTKAAPLPSPIGLPDFHMPDAPEPNFDRVNRFKARLRQLPHDIKAAKLKLSSFRLTTDDTDMMHLFGQSWPMFGYILRSLYAQFSYESYYGKPDAVVLGGMRDSLMNVMNECDGIFQEMASCG